MTWMGLSWRVLLADRRSRRNLVPSRLASPRQNPLKPALWRLATAPAVIDTLRMTSLESNLAANGTTTVPKQLRDALDAPLGGRLVWTLLADGVTLQAKLRYATVPRLATPAVLPKRLLRRGTDANANQP